LPEGNRLLCANIQINADTILEDNETFLVQISLTDPDVFFGITSSIVSIEDNDGKVYPFTIP